MLQSHFDDFQTKTLCAPNETEDQPSSYVINNENFWNIRIDNARNGLPIPSRHLDSMSRHNLQQQGENVINARTKLISAGISPQSEAWLASIGPGPTKIEGRFTYQTMRDICKRDPEMQGPLKEIVKLLAEVQVCLPTYIPFMLAYRLTYRQKGAY